MHARIATGPTGDTERLKSLIRADPSIVEKGLRLLDVDLKTGPTGTIDIVGMDWAGALSLLAFSRGDLDDALLRLVDQYVWATDNRDLLGRLYAPKGLAADRPIRCLLLAPAFGYLFLRRLALLSLIVTPYVVRRAPNAGDGGLLVASAGSLLGFEEDARAETGPDVEGVSAVAIPEAPEAVPSEEPASVPSQDDAPPPWGAPDEPLGDNFAGSIDPAAPFETLTAEEMEEFERFDQHRRRHERRPT
jgi:hypothetical protein